MSKRNSRENKVIRRFQRAYPTCAKNLRCISDLTPCHDCGQGTLFSEYYMVEDWVWEQAKPPQWSYHCDSPSFFLCIGCLEKRIGRQLTLADFTTAPVNELTSGTKSARLKSRLQRTGFDPDNYEWETVYDGEFQ